MAAAFDPRHRSAEINRWEVYWDGRRHIVLSAIAAFLLTFIVCAFVPKQFTAADRVAINILPGATGGYGDFAVLASELANQSVNFVTADAVVNPAANELGVSPGQLRSEISVGTVNAENVLDIRVTDGGPAEVVKKVHTITKYFVEYMAARYSVQFDRSEAARNALQKQIDDLDAKIQDYEDTVMVPGVNPPPHIQAWINELGILKAAQWASSSTPNYSSSALNIVPSVEVLIRSQSGSQSAPKPMLYSTVAGLIALMGAAQWIVIRHRRRSPVAI